jgi:trimeric autotransporter adhesin
VNSADTTVNLASGTGPFLVTSPNTPVTLPAGSVQTITWKRRRNGRGPGQRGER